MKILEWLARLVAAGILLQTLFFKFTGAPESVYIFETLGAEPWGRYASGAVELLAAVLLLIPRTGLYGGTLAAAVMLGAVGAHLTRLGVVVQDDGGTLFILALVVLGSALFVVYCRRAELPWRRSRPSWGRARR